MKDVKNLMRAADRARDALMKLRGSRCVELMRQLTSLAGQLQELTCESRKMGASLAHGWFAAAEQISIH
jgi:hypothetical protein